MTNSVHDAAQTAAHRLTVIGRALYLLIDSTGEDDGRVLNPVTRLVNERVIRLALSYRVLSEYECNVLSGAMAQWHVLAPVTRELLVCFISELVAVAHEPAGLPAIAEALHGRHLLTEPIRWSIARTKRLADIRASDIPPGLSAEDIAIDGREPGSG